jgi:hypothetical protein
MHLDSSWSGRAAAILLDMAVAGLVACGTKDGQGACTSPETDCPTAPACRVSVCTEARVCQHVTDPGQNRSLAPMGRPPTTWAVRIPATQEGSRPIMG